MLFTTVTWEGPPTLAFREKGGSTMARVLLVDDEPSIRLFYSDVLADQGHDVLEAMSGHEAMRLIDHEPFDLIVLDIKLRSENGLNLLQQIVHDHPGLPVILLTAYLSFQDDYTSWLANSYVLKSGDPGEFLNEVNRVMSQNQERATPNWSLVASPWSVAKER
jgi:DNA-binding response OmpR family regulator